MKPQLDTQQFTENFYHTIQGQLAVNKQIEELLSQAKGLAAAHSAEDDSVLRTLQALTKANKQGTGLLATLEVAKRKAREANPSFGPPTVCPDRASAKAAA